MCLPLFDEGGEVRQLPSAALQVVNRGLAFEIELPAPDAEHAFRKHHPDDPPAAAAENKE